MYIYIYIVCKYMLYIYICIVHGSDLCEPTERAQAHGRAGGPATAIYREFTKGGLVRGV